MGRDFVRMRRGKDVKALEFPEPRVPGGGIKRETNLNIKLGEEFTEAVSVQDFVRRSIKNATKDWNKSVFRWRQAMLQFVVMFGDRFKQG